MSSAALRPVLGLLFNALVFGLCWWPLLLCSVVAVALIIERLSSLRTSKVAPPQLLDEVVSVTRARLPSADVVNKLADNSVLGGVLGIMAGIGASELASYYFGLPTLVSTTSVIIAVAVSTVIGIFFGFYPARKAAQLDPIDALRYE